MNHQNLNIKLHLSEWIQSIEDESVLSEILKIKKQFEMQLIAEESADYAVKDDFDERFAKGMTSEKAREETRRRIREWWGK